MINCLMCNTATRQLVNLHGTESFQQKVLEILRDSNINLPANDVSEIVYSA